MGFDFRGSKALEKNCKQRCDEDVQCVAFSGIWNGWCIGCKEELNASHSNAISFKRVGRIIVDPENDGKKCGQPGDPNRIFDFRGSKALEKNCKQRCDEDVQCVAFSG